MVTVSYNSLLNLINNSQLTVGEKYKVSDYPTFQPILTARTTDELWRDGYTSEGYKLLYNPFNTDNEYNWASSYGWVYYLEANSNSAWCDWINDASSLITNSRNVHIGPYRTVSGWEIPQVSVEDSEDIVVSGFGDIAITNSRNVTVGNSNSGTINGSQNVTVGSDNTDLALQSALNCTIGDNNDTLSLSNVEGVNVNNRNTAITVQKGFNIVGSDNDNLLLNGEGNEVLNDCRGVSLNNDFNQVDASSFVEVDGKYNQVEQSDGVVLTGSVGNTVTDSKLVYLDDVNNNEVWANNYINSQAAYLLPDGETVRQYYPGDPEAFVRVANINGNKVKKVVTNTINSQRMQTDNAALVVDTEKEVTKDSSKSANTYYIGKDGLWNADGITTDEADVTVMISKADSLHCYVKGAGRYRIGETCTVGYSWLDDNWTCKFEDENGNLHNAPYTFIVAGNTTVYAVVQEGGQIVVLDNQLLYRTSDDQVVTPYTSSFGGRSIVSNTYVDGMGIIEFDGTLTTIGNNAFNNRTTITHVWFPDTLTSVGQHAFDRCPIENLNLKNITTVGYEAFDFHHTETLHIPATCTSLNYNPFRSAYLRYITVDPNNSVYNNGSAYGGSNCVYTGTTLQIGCPNTVIPNNCTVVGRWALSSMPSLTTVDLPATVTSIDNCAIDFDTAIVSNPSLSVVYARSTPSFGSDVFYRQKTNGTLYYASGVNYSTWLSKLPSGWTAVQL